MRGHADALLLVVQQQHSDPGGGLFSLVPALCDAIQVDSYAGLLLGVADAALADEAEYCRCEHCRRGSSTVGGHGTEDEADAGDAGGGRDGGWVAVDRTCLDCGDAGELSFGGEGASGAERRIWLSHDEPIRAGLCVHLDWVARGAAIWRGAKDWKTDFRAGLEGYCA